MAKKQDTSPMAQKNNLINMCMTEVMAADWVRLGKRFAETTDTLMRTKGIEAARGYSFMGNIFVSHKHAQMECGMAPHFPQLSFELWSEGEDNRKLQYSIERERDKFKMNLFAHLTRVSEDNPVRWVSSLPDGLIKILPSPVCDFPREYDMHYYRPGEPRDAQHWQELMDFIHRKLALRLIV